MEITLSELKEKEVVNAFDGKKLGRIVDLIFDADLSLLLELVLPGEKSAAVRVDAGGPCRTERRGRSRAFRACDLFGRQSADVRRADGLPRAQ